MLAPSPTEESFHSSGEFQEHSKGTTLRRLNKTSDLRTSIVPKMAVVKYASFCGEGALIATVHKLFGIRYIIASSMFRNFR